MNSKKLIEYVEPEIPSEFKLKYMMANGDNVLRDSYETWRIFALNVKTGKITFIGNNTSNDWKSERNAKERAAWFAKDRAAWFAKDRAARFNQYNTRVFPDMIFVVRKCRVTIEELA